MTGRGDEEKKAGQTFLLRKTWMDEKEGVGFPSLVAVLYFAATLSVYCMQPSVPDNLTKCQFDVSKQALEAIILMHASRIAAFHASYQTENSGAVKVRELPQPCMQHVAACRPRRNSSGVMTNRGCGSHNRSTQKGVPRKAIVRRCRSVE